MDQWTCFLCGELYDEAGPFGWIPHVLQAHEGSLTARLILRELATLPLATTPRSPSSTRR